MKNKIINGLLCLAFSIPSLHAQNYTNAQSRQFNENWLFTNDAIKHAEQVNYDVSNWRTIDLPHDWSIEDLPNQNPGTIQGPFSKYSAGKASTGWTVGGIGWYRKKFETEKEWQDKVIAIHFDGIYMNSDVWLNGYHLGYHPYGYTPFYYDLTSYLKPVGQDNILVVRARNEGQNSRWYAGSGIYRNVFLSVHEPIHVDKWGISITTPEVSESSAKVKINTTINNKKTAGSHITLITTLISPQGKEVNRAETNLSLAANTKQESGQEINVSTPHLWSLESPAMYTAITEIKEGNQTIERLETPFGIRSIVFDGEKGFLLNGKLVKLMGGCLHHDNGPLGAISVPDAEERKLKILKNSGYNAIRSSHNPASSVFLETCDRLGILVIDEAFDTWVRAKKPQDYHLYFNEWWKKDLEAMILRGRNHPSIIMWSIGNEVYEGSDLLGQELAKQLADEVRKIDPTRPVTEGMVFLPPFTKNPWTDYEPHIAHLDVDGYNYFLEDRSNFFLRDSATLNRFDTEYAKHPKKLYYTSEALAIGALGNWTKTEENHYVLGAFKWTAFDYIGESGIGKSRLRREERPEPRGVGGMGVFYKDEWPIYNAFCGDFDLIGNKKQSSYYQDVVWRLSPVEMLVHQPIPEGMLESVATWGYPEETKSWTWPGREGQTMQVNVHTRGEIVKLELNGKIIGEKKVPEGDISVSFDVPYKSGKLVARSFINGKETGSSTLSTTGKPVAIRMKAESNALKADKKDLCYVQVEVIDAKENVVPYVDDIEITYQLSGNAQIVAVGNGAPDDMSSFQQPRKKVYQGRGLVILKSTDKKPGIAALKAEATGLKGTSVNIEMK